MEPTNHTLEETRKIAPGAEEVVQGGDTLIITDQNGQEIAVKGQECDEVLAVLVALDNYVMARAGDIQGVVLDSLWNKLRQAYAALPSHVAKHLPSNRVDAVRVPLL